MFHRYLSKKLFDNDMSQRELAIKMNIHESLVSRWISGERVPTLPNIIKLASIFGVTTDEIIQSMEVQS
jgi:transcriptional regulator with XRE-family HTH domain